MLVSIVVPMYNSEKYIERCARSLLCQTYREIELIFVDDASTDGTVAILEQLLVRHPEATVKIVRHEVNRGCAAARMTGMLQAGGNYITQVDSDDSVLPTYVEKLVGKALEDDADVVICDYRVERGKNDVRRVCHNALPERTPLSYLLSGEWHNALWNKLMRRDLLVDHNIRFIAGLNMCDDKLVTTQAVYFARKISMVDDPLYCYNRANAGAVSMRRTHDNRVQVVSVLEYLDDFFAAHPLTRECEEKSWQRFKSGVAGMLLASGENELLKRCTHRIERQSPWSVWKHPAIPFYYKVLLVCYHCRLMWLLTMLQAALGKLRNR